MEIHAHIAARLQAALGWPPERAGELVALLTMPPDPALGDVALPCFQLARELRRAPPLIARELAARLAPDDLIERVAPEGAYLNLHLQRPAVTAGILGAIAAARGRYGSGDAGAGRTVVVDFSAPNIAKPFHFGHLRSTNLGADLARLLAFQGWRVIRRNYLGDWGTQFGFVILAWQRWGDEGELAARAIDYLVELYVRAYQASEQDPGIRDEARDLFRRLEQGDPAIRALWERFRALSLTAFMGTYQRLGIDFDSYEGEAALNDRVLPVVQRFQQAGVAVHSQGAIVVEVSDVLGRDIAPCMLQKSDGASTYAARDCAEALARWERYGFAANIYVVARQEDHFAQVFAALSKLGRAEGWAVDWPARCENVTFGFVRGMSTRKGQAVWLEAALDEARDRARRVRDEKSAANPRGFPALPEAELMAISEAVGQAALLYFDVSSRRLTDLSFDWDTVLRFEGNTGPYLQYAHARMCGIFRKAAEEDLAPSRDPGDLALLDAAEEWALVMKLNDFPAVVARATVQREPFEVAQYLHGLASDFSTFYNRHPVLDRADVRRSGARLALVDATRSVLRTGLGLLGIRALEVM